MTDPGTVREAEAEPTRVWEGCSDFHLQSAVKNLYAGFAGMQVQHDGHWFCFLQTI